MDEETIEELMTIRDAFDTFSDAEQQEAFVAAGIKGRKQDPKLERLLQDLPPPAPQPPGQADRLLERIDASTYDTTEMCRACHAPIIFARTAEGRRMPLDKEPLATGFVLELDADGVVCTRSVQVRTSHFATCPNAAQFRRKRPGKK